MNKYLDTNNKKALILTGIAIFTLLAFIFSATYAYFIASQNLLTTSRTLDVVTNDTISVVATGSTSLSMDLNLDDMRKFGVSKKYYATRDGKTETPTKEQFVNIESNSSKEIYCTYTISLTNNDTTDYSNMIDQIKINGKENEVVLNFYINNNVIKSYDMKTAEWTDDKIRFSGIINDIEPLAKVGIDIDMSLTNLEEVDQATYLALSALNLSLKLEEINCDSTEAPKIENIAVNSTSLNSLDVTMNDGTYELAAYCVDHIARSKGECEWITNNDKEFNVPINETTSGIYYLHVKDIRGYIADSAGFMVDANKMPKEFKYVAPEGSQKYTVPADDTYVIQLWGAEGSFSNTSKVQNGASYVSGEINLTKGTELFFFVGSTNDGYLGGYNGGGNGGHNSQGDAAGGGGATDVRTVNGSASDNLSLISRIMVAAGSGGWNQGAAGGLRGYNGYDASYNGYQGIGANQNQGGTKPSQYGCGGSASTIGTFGLGGIGGSNTNGPAGGSGGGGGWYGGSGASALCSGTWSGGGGSSYISGHTGCVTVTSVSSSTPKSGCSTETTNIDCSKHPNGYVFINGTTKMIDGMGYKWTNVKGVQEQMPNPEGGYYDLGKGHTGNGYALIKSKFGTTITLY